MRSDGTFENYCTCGGYAWQMNGRSEADPHMSWCPQRDEYLKWRATMPIQGNGMNDPIGHVARPVLGLAERIDNHLAFLKDELLSAMTKHKPMHSAHEGHSVIREELDELWDHVKADTGQTRAARKEAMQVAAMGLRYALDLCSEEQVKRAEEAIAYKNRP